MYLLDTNILLMWLADNPRLSAKIKKIIQDPNNRILLSAVNMWEIAIKKRLNKLHVPNNFFDVIEDEAFEKLPITYEHARSVYALPLIHNDPFDRALIAQARYEDLTLITTDKTIARYEVQCFGM